MKAADRSPVSRKGIIGARTESVRRRILLAGLAVFLSQTVALPQVFLKSAFPALSFSSPLGLYPTNDTTNRLCVLEQAGVIRIFPIDSTASSTKTFLDIHSNVISGGELGLLGLAFHPHFASNGYFYVDYTRNSPLRTVISRFRVSASNPDSADPSSEYIILQQPQPYTNHNGGQLAFGPDGYLYIAFGDGGSGGDPQGNGQSTSTLLGKLLRINIDSAAGAQHYAIPPDNPFYGDTSKKREIYSYGLRNPWRFSFDGRTIWCGDVGQDQWEEIDTIVSGGNYGWNIMEGFHCYSPSTGCNQSGLILPIWNYHHDSGRCSITGGFVYRGSAAPSLTGKYLYADYCSGEIWDLQPVPSSPPVNKHLLGAGTAISSFGADRNGEIYVCEYSAGKIYKIWGSPPGPFTLLSPSDGAVAQPKIEQCLWTASAGAVKYRFQVAVDSAFASLVVDDSTVTDTAHEAGPLPDSTLLFWRVRAINGAGGTPYTPFRRFTTAPASVLYHLYAGWNMISVPVDPPDRRRTVLFPSSASRAFVYDPRVGYSTGDTVPVGPGFWLKFPDSATMGLAGVPRYTDTVAVVTGWNMIGSIAQSLPAVQITSVPGGMVTSPFFGYAGSYFASSTVEPGKGYWVRVNQPGSLILASSFGAGSSPIRIEPISELPPPPPDERGAGLKGRVPGVFTLAQNYPNPFNPSTSISYGIPRSAHVRLQVFDLLGRLIGTIVDQERAPGTYSADWDAREASSGVYYYRLTAGGFVETKKALLLR